MIAMMKKNLTGLMASVISAAILLTPMVASADTNGTYKAYINWVNPGYTQTSINVSFAGDSDRLYQGDGDIDTFNTSWLSLNNYSDWCHYATGNWTATLRSYDTTGAVKASDANSFTNP
jgi:hypothetical protein